MQENSKKSTKDKNRNLIDATDTIFDVPIIIQAFVGLLLLSIGMAIAAAHPYFYVFRASGSPFESSLVLNALASLSRIGAATLIANFSAVAIALCIIVLNRSLAYSVGVPIALIIAITPPTIWNVLAIIWFGVGGIGPVFVVVCSILFLLTALCINAFYTIHRNIWEISEQFQVSRAKTAMKILIPERSNDLLLLLRISLAFAWIPLSLAELSGTKYGLGNVIQLGRQLYSESVVVGAWLIILGCAVVLDLGLRFCRRIISK